MKQSLLRRAAALVTVGLLAAAAMFVGIGPSAATHVDPIPIPGSGNLTCEDLAPEGETWNEAKIDPPENTTISAGGGSITVSNFDGVTFDWSSTLGIDAVFVKSGVDASQLYVYDPEATGDLGLTTQDGKEISHISFCWDPDPPPTTTTTTTVPPTTTTTTTVPPTTTTTTTVPPTTTTTTEPRGAIGDLVWNDVNDNGIQDPGEVGVAGATVRLFNADSDTLLAVTTTDANGKYLFDGLQAGNYYLVFVLPANYKASDANQGADPEVDSDADPVTLRTAVVALAAGQVDLSWDAGIFRVQVLATTIVTTVPSTLPFAGFSGSNAAGAAVMLLLAGGLILLAARRRGDESPEDPTLGGWSSSSS